MGHSSASLLYYVLDVLAFLRALSVHVLTCFACSRTPLLGGLACLRFCVLGVLICLHAYAHAYLRFYLIISYIHILHIAKNHVLQKKM